LLAYTQGLKQTPRGIAPESEIQSETLLAYTQGGEQRQIVLWIDQATILLI